ncbi:MAG: VOC family protein [Elainellaceae cyanobacterium]
MQPTQMLHAALLVSDLPRAEAFYAGILGLRKIERSLSYAGAWYALGEAQIHLIVSDQLKADGLGSGEPQPADAHPKWGRRPHLAIAIPDLEAAIAHLNRAGCPIQMSASGRRALFAQDPDGNVIELTEQR